MLPRLFEIGSFPIHTYGLLLALALLIGIELMARLAQSENIDRNKIWDFGFIIILSSLLGAKLLMVVTDFGIYWADPSRLFSIEFLQAAGVFYGGLLGALLGTWYFLRRNPELGFWQVGDVAAPCVALGQSIGRLGCFAAGCDYGKPSELPWAVTFTNEYAGRYVGVPLHVPLHPTQIYEAAGTFVIFLFLLRTYRRKHFNGQVFLYYLITYAAFRFCIEFVRGDVDRGLYFDGLLSTSQIISLLILPLSIYIFWKRQGRTKTA